MTRSQETPEGEAQGASPSGDVVDPWKRFGWLLAAVWLVFLVFPLGSAVLADVGVVWRALTIALIITFALVYLRGFWADDQPPGTTRRLHLYLLVMGLLALATVPVIGLSALGLVPFMLSFSGMALPTRQALLLLGAAMVLAVVAPLLAGQLDDLWFFLLIYPMVGLTLILISALDQRAGRQRESQQRLTISEERERVARDVHDVLGHSLTVVTVKSELAERLVDVDPERAKAEMAEVRSISRQALAEIRATVAGLRVARLTDELAAAEQALTGAGMRLEVRGSPEEVDPRHRIVLAWAVREAVTNVVRHSGARLCQITLGQDRLSVRDDGRGVSGRREGNGIGGLRERVEQQGGSVSLGPGAPGTGDGARGSGTLLEVRLGGADDTGETTAKVAT